MNLVEYDLSDFHIGDHVRIMPLNKIKQIFTGRRHENLFMETHPSEPVFNEKMKLYCEKEFTITDIKNYTSFPCVEGHGLFWTITTAMIEKV